MVVPWRCVRRSNSRVSLIQRDRGDTDRMRGWKTEIGRESVGESTQGHHPSAATPTCKCRRTTRKAKETQPFKSCCVVLPALARCHIPLRGYCNNTLIWKTDGIKHNLVGMLTMRMLYMYVTMHVTVV